MKRLLAFVLLLSLFTLSVSAHPGRTDSKGGHNSPTGYHYHHGNPEHQHIGNYCPYDFVNNERDRNDSTTEEKKSVQASPSTSKAPSSSNSSASNKKTSTGSRVWGFIGWLFEIFPAFFVIVLFGGIYLFSLKNYIARKKAEKKERAERKAQWQAEKLAFLEKKKTFIEEFGGKSLREIAGVPSHIVFKNGLPIDNNDAPFGSFTVYCSNSGKCYHDKQGCSSAHKAVHYLDAKTTHRPCSKCCKTRSIPQWFTDYYDLKDKVEQFKYDAMVFGIEITPSEIIMD